MFMASITFAAQSEQLRNANPQTQSQPEVQSAEVLATLPKPKMFAQWFEMDGKLVRHWLPNT